MPSSHLTENIFYMFRSGTQTNEAGLTDKLSENKSNHKGKKVNDSNINFITNSNALLIKLNNLFV